MATCKGWTKKGSLEEFQNGAHLEDEEREDLEISWMQEVTTGMSEREREREELTTWNGSTGKNGNKNKTGHRKM